MDERCDGHSIGCIRFPGDVHAIFSWPDITGCQCGRNCCASSYDTEPQEEEECDQVSVVVEDGASTQEEQEAVGRQYDSKRGFVEFCGESAVLEFVC